jgi:hypothetical protein
MCIIMSTEIQLPVIERPRIIIYEFLERHNRNTARIALTCTIQRKENTHLSFHESTVVVRGRQKAHPVAQHFQMQSDDTGRRGV